MNSVRSVDIHGMSREQLDEYVKPIANRQRILGLDADDIRLTYKIKDSFYELVVGQRDYLSNFYRLYIKTGNSMTVDIPEWVDKVNVIVESFDVDIFMHNDKMFSHSDNPISPNIIIRAASYRKREVNLMFSNIIGVTVETKKHISLNLFGDKKYYSLACGLRAINVDKCKDCHIMDISARYVFSDDSVLERFMGIIKRVIPRVKRFTKEYNSFELSHLTSYPYIESSLTWNNPNEKMYDNLEVNSKVLIRLQYMDYKETAALLRDKEFIEFMNTEAVNYRRV